MEFEVVQGFFAQNDKDKLSLLSSLVWELPRFGLKQRWGHLRAEVARRKAAGENIKVLFLQRHGQSIGDLGQSLYAEEWPYWSVKKGNGVLEWGLDPPLTSIGVRQAKTANDRWKREFANGAPMPDLSLCSPFTCAGLTAAMVQKGLFSVMGASQPLFVEDLRERTGVDTSTQRISRKRLQENFPQFQVEPQMADEDEMWSLDHKEGLAAFRDRVKEFMRRVFLLHDNAQFISMCTHKGVLDVMQDVMGHKKVDIPPGGMLPVVVRASFGGMF